jgi:hypothetical protein
MNTHDPDPEPPGTRTTEHSPLNSVGLANWLIHRAARNAPADLADRLEEEWLADLATHSSPASRLRFALGCCWAIRAIANDYCAAAVAVASPAADGKLAISELGGDPNFFPRNSLAVIAVVAFHIAVLYALAMGLGINVIQMLPSSFQTRILPNPQTAAPPPSLPPPAVADVRIQVPPPEFPQTSFPDDSVDTVAQPKNDPPLSSTPTATTHEISRVTGGPRSWVPSDRRFLPP